MKMSSEDRQLRKLAEQEREQRDILERIEKGIQETRDGARLHWAPDKQRYAVIPRQVDSQLRWTHLLERGFENMLFVAQYSYDAFGRMIITLLNMIPDMDMDDKFNEEVSNATMTVKVATGKYRGYGGSIREVFEEATEYDYHKLLRAMVSLLRRRGLYATPRLWDEHVAEMFWQRQGENKPVERDDKGRYVKK